jgi:hypothetical protein
MVEDKAMQEQHTLLYTSFLVDVFIAFSSTLKTVACRLLTWLTFVPEDGGSRSVSTARSADCFLGLVFESEDRATAFLRNIYSVLLFFLLLAASLTYCLIMKIEALSSSGTSTDFCQNTALHFQNRKFSRTKHSSFMF